MKEIERIFKIDNIETSKTLRNMSQYTYKIKQIYLSFKPFEIRLRTEILPLNGLNTFYYITFKLGKGLIRLEFTKRINENICKFLWKFQKAGISKIRYCIPTENFTLQNKMSVKDAVFDDFKSLNLMTLELEFYNLESAQEFNNHIISNLTELTNDYNFSKQTLEQMKKTKIDF